MGRGTCGPSQHCLEWTLLCRMGMVAQAAGCPQPWEGWEHQRMLWEPWNKIWPQQLYHM